MQHALYLALPVLVLPAPQLANRAWLPSYARAVQGLLSMGGPSAFTEIAIRIPVSDPLELVPGPAVEGPVRPQHHRRISSLSSRPPSIHQAQLSISQLTQLANPGTNGPNAVGPNGSALPGGVAGARIAPATSQNSGMSSKSMTHSALAGDPSSTWEMWDAIRSLCGYHPRLTVLLDLSTPLPPSVGALSRWAAEPVKHIWLSAPSFIPNAKGYPVLSKACQAFLRGLTRQTPTLVLSDTDMHRHPSGGPNAYLQYVRHITSQGAPASTISPQGPAEVAGGYGDFLQAPLQPLMDDLGAATYDVFERDPVKYAQYEEAIYLAVIDKVAVAEAAGLIADLVVVIAGAGRGPLVACTLAALERAKRPARVYAVEKNPNAFTTLQERKAIEWGDSVDILFGDMRELPVPELADVLVSELLGSFGDNELSPECIDGGMRFLKPDGISIPTSYTAHLAPLASAKLHQDVMQRKEGSAEVPYVVMMQNVNLLSGDGGGASGRCGERIQQCWQFEHPRRDLILSSTGLPVTNSHNTRSANLTFHIPHASSCHGFAGYFEAHLYGNIGLSIHPDTAHRVSPDMFSWFPLFFPLREALYLPSGAELEVNIWRLTDHKMKRVWYEWNAEVYLPVTSQVHHTSHEQQPPNVGRVKIGQSLLHNAGGAHYWVGL